MIANEFMLEMKRKWKAGEFNDFYDRICFGARDNDVFDVSNMEFYILEAVGSKMYDNPHTKGMGSIMLGFMYGDILVNNLKDAKWKFKSNPTSWNDWVVVSKKGGNVIEIKPFSRVARFIENCEKLGQGALEKGSNLKSLLDTAKKM